MTNTCKKCGTAFTDALSICPVCKTAILPTPSQGESQVTASYAFLQSSLELVKLKSRKLTVLLSLFFGFTGAALFYLNRPKMGMLFAGFSLIVLVMFWGIFPELNLGFYASVGLILIQTILAFYYWFNPDLKDGRGELLK